MHPSARSTVRSSLGIAFEGATYEQAFSVVDARVRGHLADDECLFYQTSRGPLVVVPMGRGVFRFLTIGDEGLSWDGGMQKVLEPGYLVELRQLGGRLAERPEQAVVGRQDGHWVLDSGTPLYGGSRDEAAADQARLHEAMTPWGAGGLPQLPVRGLGVAEPLRGRVRGR